jgi:hypothetical protein
MVIGVLLYFVTSVLSVTTQYKEIQTHCGPVVGSREFEHLGGKVLLSSLVTNQRVCQAYGVLKGSHMQNPLNGGGNQNC